MPGRLLGFKEEISSCHVPRFNKTEPNKHWGRERWPQAKTCILDNNGKEEKALEQEQHLGGSLLISYTHIHMKQLQIQGLSPITALQGGKQALPATFSLRGVTERAVKCNCQAREDPLDHELEDLKHVGTPSGKGVTG